MSWIMGLLLALAFTGSLYYVLSTLALSLFLRGKRESHVSDARPRVSLLKPVSGIDPESSANYASCIRQDYPDYEVLFGVLDLRDPAIDVILSAIQGHKGVSLHIGTTIHGANNKTRILHQLSRRASGEIMVIADADTRVEPDFLNTITAPFEDASVGVVTCLYRGVRARGSADALEGLHMTCIFAPGVACAQSLGGIDFGLGAAIAIRSSVLRSIGGFESIVDYLADDFQLGRRTALLGHRVRLSRYVIDVVLSGEGLRSVLTRELRWSRTTRVSRPFGHLGLLLTFGSAYAVGFAAASGFSELGWRVLGGVWLIRALTAWIGAGRLGDREFVRRLWLLPIRDLFSFGVWVAGYLGRTVRWRGRRMRVARDGRMQKV